MKNQFYFVLFLIFNMFSLVSNSFGQSTMEGWYIFTPENDYSKTSMVGLEDWNAEPAGKYGRIIRQDDKLLYNGKEIKLWGLNNCYGFCKPDKQSAEKHAAFYRKFGINTVRLHKYADNYGKSGIQSEKSFVELDPVGLDKMDYYVSTLKENGIYTKLSPTFGVKVGAADTVRLPWHREIGDLQVKDRIRATYGSIYFSYELQDMQIEQTTNLLNHTNPYTGMRYADDPAIFCVELFNEDAVLWFGSAWTMQRYNTLRIRISKEFSRFLLEKYGSEEKWKSAWSEKAIFKEGMNLDSFKLDGLINPDEIKGHLPNESITEGTAVPWSYPWLLDVIMDKENKEFDFLKQRLFDTSEFLIQLQNRFYTRFVKAIRETGYEGEIITSNWQAGSSIGHYLNLHSDHLFGMVDRHNYFGGGGTNALYEQEKFNNGTMLSFPGKGALNVGLQQVNNRPFMLSEWIHVQPNEWYAEGPAIMGAYGWGLNGWDVSYMFENGDDGEFRNRIIGRHTRWDVANPAVLVNFATISRQVRRMDVSEAPETQYLNVHIPSLLEGKLDFNSQVKQQHDEKTFTTDKVPTQALAATRVAVRFTDNFMETPPIDMQDYMKGSTIVSSTKELEWTPAQNGEEHGGYFTINTEGTKAFVGFAPGGQTFDLGDGYSIEPAKGFSVIYLSAKEENETLEDAKEIVVTAMARARNTGMKFNAEGNVVLDPGTAPIVLEPVKANIKVPFNGKLLILDHDGTEVRSERQISKSLSIDGTIDNTPFYVIRK